MKAKETVMMPEQTRAKRKELFPHGHKDCHECEQFIREAQAEISLRAGRREVVEYIEKNSILYGADYVDRQRWQAQKKEWGITQ